jgi:hypothetical protein
MAAAAGSLINRSGLREARGDLFFSMNEALLDCCRLPVQFYVINWVFAVSPVPHRACNTLCCNFVCLFVCLLLLLRHAARRLLKRNLCLARPTAIMPCLHGKQHNMCKDCGGSQICEHGKQKSLCKLCGGSSICQHGTQKHLCKPCGGISICQHARQRSKCSLCKSFSQRYCSLDEDVVADGCDETEVMQLLSGDFDGNFLFNNVYGTLGNNRQNPFRQSILYAAPLHSNRCLNHNHNRCFFSDAPPHPLQSAGSILQFPSRPRLCLRRPCSASCSIRVSCGCSCCAAPLCHILLLPHLLFLLPFLLRPVAAPLLTWSKIGRPSPLTRLSRSYPTYYNAASTLCTLTKDVS